jgi:hypothetical protein
MNGKELKEYDYRLSLQSIDHLSVDGDLILNDIVSEREEYGQNITVFFSALGRQILCQSMDGWKEGLIGHYPLLANPL